MFDTHTTSGIRRAVDACSRDAGADFETIARINGQTAVFLQTLFGPSFEENSTLDDDQLAGL